MRKFFSRRSIGIFAAVVVAAFTLSACTTNSTSSRAPNLRLGIFTWPGYEPLHLGIDQDFIPKSDVSLIEFSSATQLTQAYRNGAVDAATLTLDELLTLASVPGQDPQIILALDFSNGGDAIIAKPKFKTMSDLKGRRIGVEDTALGAYVLARALELAKLTLNDVQIVPLPLSEHVQAYEKGLVDAVVTFEPLSGQLVAAGANEVFDSSQIPGEIVDVLVVRKKYLETNPDISAALIAGWFAALDYQREYPEAAAQFMAERQNISTQAFTDSLGGLQFAGVEENSKLFSNQAEELKAKIRNVEAVMLQNEFLRAPIDPATVIDGTPLQRYLDKRPN